MLSLAGMYCLAAAVGAAVNSRGSTDKFGPTRTWISRALGIGFEKGRGAISLIRAISASIGWAGSSRRASRGAIPLAVND
jgi:hypothetical protein